MDVTQSAIFILVTHRAKLCKPGRATDRGTKERTNRRRHHHQSYTRFASSVRSVLYPSTISLPRLSWAHCSPVAGKWRRESKNPRRKPEKHGDSHQIRRRDWPGWKSVETILKGAARDPETWRGRECCSIGRVFYFSANFI